MSREARSRRWASLALNPIIGPSPSRLSPKSREPSRRREELGLRAVGLPDAHAARCEVLLDARDRVLAEVDHARDERRVGLSLDEHGPQVLGRASPARG